MTITEVSKKYDISQDTLRYYERIGLIPAVGRTRTARKQILVEQRQQLLTRMEEMQRILQRLNTKIQHYDDVVIEAEHKLTSSDK